MAERARQAAKAGFRVLELKVVGHKKGFDRQRRDVLSEQVGVTAGPHLDWKVSLQHRIAGRMTGIEAQQFDEFS